MRHITCTDIQSISVHLAKGLAVFVDLLTDLDGACLCETPFTVDVTRQLLYTSSATVQDPYLDYLAVAGGSSLSLAAITWLLEPLSWPFGLVLLLGSVAILHYSWLIG